MQCSLWYRPDLNSQNDVLDDLMGQVREAIKNGDLHTVQEIVGNVPDLINHADSEVSVAHMLTIRDAHLPTYVVEHCGILHYVLLHLCFEIVSQSCITNSHLRGCYIERDPYCSACCAID